MKLLFAAIMFVAVSFVCAADSTQNVLPSPQEDSKPSYSQPQGGHEKPGGATPVVNTPTSNPVANKTTTEDRQGNPTPIGKEGDGKPPWVAIISLIVSFASAAIALHSVRQTDKTRRITERAYIAAEQWEIEGGYIMCRVANRGRTPATLLSGYTEYRLQGEASSLPFPYRRLLKRDFQGAELPAQGVFPMQVGSPGHDVWKRIKELRDVTLFVIAHLQFRDVFGEVRLMHFVMEYDARIGKFVIADIRTSEKE